MRVDNGMILLSPTGLTAYVALRVPDHARAQGRAWRPRGIPAGGARPASIRGVPVHETAGHRSGTQAERLGLRQSTRRFGRCLLPQGCCADELLDGHYSESAQTFMSRLSASLRSDAVVRSSDPDENLCLSGSRLVSESAKLLTSAASWS